MTVEGIELIEDICIVLDTVLGIVCEIPEVVDVEVLPDATSEVPVPTTEITHDLEQLGREVLTPFFLEEEDFAWWKQVQDQLWASHGFKVYYSRFL